MTNRIASPDRNSLGPVYNSFNDLQLARQLDIRPGDAVLDIGGGASPFALATVVTEPYLSSDAHRGGHPIQKGIDYVMCYAESLPFRDKVFEFAIARQVFEHTNDPLAACHEMMRVAKRGFIETPSKAYELISGPNPTHNWVVSNTGNTITFEQRMFVRHPLGHLGLSLVPSSDEGQFFIHKAIKNATNVQFYWDGDFSCVAQTCTSGYSYTIRDYAAEAHLDVALCGIRQGAYFIAHRENDARQAVKLKDDWAVARNTLGVILWLQGRFDEARDEFHSAASLDDRDEYSFNCNIECGSKDVKLVGCDYDLPIDEAFAARYLTKTGFDLDAMLYGEHCPQ